MADAAAAITDFLTSPVGRWLMGLAVSWIGGHSANELFFGYLRRTMGDPQKDEGDVHVPPALTGFIERTFFTALIGISGPTVSSAGIATLMFGWMTAKMAANWARKDVQPAYPFVRAYMIRALLAGLISMMFAAIGGWIIVGGSGNR